MLLRLIQHSKNIFFYFIDSISGAKRASFEGSQFLLKRQRHNNRANKALVVCNENLGPQSELIEDLWNYGFVLPHFSYGNWFWVCERTGRPIFGGTVVDYGFPITADHLISKVIPYIEDCQHEELLKRIHEMLTFINDVEVGTDIGINNDGKFYVREKTKVKTVSNSH